MTFISVTQNAYALRHERFSKDQCVYIAPVSARF